MQNIAKCLAATYLLLSIAAFAGRNDPNCLNVPTEAPPEAWELMDPVPLGGPVTPPPPPQVLNRETLLALGLRFSDLSYRAPDLETSPLPATFVQNYMDFYQAIPRGYELYHLASDPANGLKYAIFKPIANSGNVAWVLAVAGTQTFLDRIVDGKMGRKQMDRLATLFSKCLFQDAAGRPLLDIPLVITGHSLGGGLSEALYHQLQAKLSLLRARGFASPLQLVTFNAFGGQALLSEMSVNYNEQNIEPAKVANYFISGDLVSRVGKHIGPTFEIVPFNADGSRRALGLGPAHFLKSFAEVIKANAELGSKLLLAPVVPPQQIALNKFYESQKDGKLGFSLFLYPSAQYLVRSARGEIASAIENTAQHIVNLKSKGIELKNMLTYVQLLSSDEELRLRNRMSITGKSDNMADHLRTTVDEAIRAYNANQDTPSGFFHGPGGILRDP